MSVVGNGDRTGGGISARPVVGCVEGREGAPRANRITPPGQVFEAHDRPGGVFAGANASGLVEGRGVMATAPFVSGHRAKPADGVGE